jgi:hypothetical protein
MTYTVGIPFDGQSLSNSKPQIRSNFTVINTAFSVNHLALGAVDQGKHKFLQMPQQGSAPSTALNEGGLYAKDVSGITSLFWRQENNGAEVRLTGVTPVALKNGYSTLPGGLIIQWGSISTVNFNTPVLFATSNINFPNNCFQVFAQTHNTTVSSSIIWSVINISTTGFNLGTFSPFGIPFSWFAIGN